LVAGWELMNFLIMAGFATVIEVLVLVGVYFLSTGPSAVVQRPSNHMNSLDT